MKISYNWLHQFLPSDFSFSADELAQRLLLLGFEVSSIDKRGPGFSGVVIGEILEIQKHPNADRLSLCSVTNGKEKLSIVCGAKNVAVGARVPVALIGAVLPGGKKIERSKIRGQESQGMICSSVELGLSTKQNGDGILILPPNTLIGEDAAKILGESDQIMEVEITPNRPDCLSHYGLARELSIHFGCALQRLNPSTAFKPDHGIPSRRIDIPAKEACPRYLGRDFKDLKIGPSPAWMVQRLEAVGLRSINNLVDVTNYVLFELGHPLHAFDAEKLQGDQILVRFARADENIKALDGKSYALSSADLVIADASGPVAVAGVIGGEPASVTEKTKTAFLESACFTPGFIRRTSKNLRLRTDSSYRFERGTDPENAALASARATELILQLCAGRPGELIDAYPQPRKAPPIEITSSRVNQILGSNFADEKIETVLKRLASSVTPGNNALLIYPPPYRLDLKGQCDLAEEVGRHLGYDAIPSTPSPIKLDHPNSIPLVDLIHRFQDRLQAQGFCEAYNLDFISTAQMARCGLDPRDINVVSILNPLSEDYAYLRPTLLAGLLQSASYNLSRGAKDLRLFEVGHAYAGGTETTERTQLAGLMIGDFPPESHWRTHKTPTDFYAAKGVVEDLLKSQPQITWQELKDSRSSLFHPKAALQFNLQEKRLGVVGLIHPKLAKAWDFEGMPAAAFVIEDMEMLASHPLPAPHMAPFSPFPSITRDLSIVLDAEVPYAQIRDALISIENLNRLELRDVYTGKGIATGKKSFTLRFTFTRLDRTLRDEEVAKTMESALSLLSERFKAKLRA